MEFNLEACGQVAQNLEGMLAYGTLLRLMEDKDYEAMNCEVGNYLKRILGLLDILRRAYEGVARDAPSEDEQGEGEDEVDEESPSPEEAEEEDDENGEKADEEDEEDVDEGLDTKEDDEDEEDDGPPHELVAVADQDRDDQTPRVITPPVIVAAEIQGNTSAEFTVDVDDAGDHDPGRDQEKERYEDEGGGSGQVKPAFGEEKERSHVGVPQNGEEWCGELPHS